MLRGLASGQQGLVAKVVIAVVGLHGEESDAARSTCEAVFFVRVVEGGEVL
jgi:hypothetical protein